MNPLFVTAIRAAKRALDEINHHERNRSHASAVYSPEPTSRAEDQTASARLSVMQRVLSWFHRKGKS